LPVLLASLAELPPFNPTGVALADVAKTGLGSSAALITSLVTALLVQSDLIAPDQLASVSARRLAHNVAQFVHCLAQGKVGSGFDVSAGVFGSQLYTRFNPAVLQPLMDDSVRYPFDPPPPSDLVACLFLLFNIGSRARNRSCHSWRRRTWRGMPQ
jgi:phosphomevalonate kinase